MIPNNDDYEYDPTLDDSNDVAEEFAAETESSKTYKINFDNFAFKGTCEGDDAIKQAIFMILNTERYEYPIYSWDYGIELNDLKQMPITQAMSELPNRIKEALEVDDRIETVDSFVVERIDKDKLDVSYTVHTETGDEIDVGSEVEL